MCRFLIDNFDYLVLLNGILIMALVFTILASFVRSNDNSWDLSYLLRSLGRFKFLNPKEYGIFAVILIAMIVVFIASLFMTPQLLRFCV